MFVADAHCDTLFAMTIENVPAERCAVNTGRLTEGGVGIQTYALFTGMNGPAGTPYQDGKRMLAESYNLPIEFLRGKLPELPPDSPKGIISCEGGEMFVGSIDKLAEFDDETRIRMVALTWNHENEIAYPASSGSRSGLKAFGRTLIHEMDQRGILTDVSHLNDAGFWEVVEKTKLPPIASHSDCRWLCPSIRNLTKDMVRALIDRNGFMGINFYSAFLREDGAATLDDVLRHIDALCELGAENIVGFGSDFDGIESWPDGLGNPADFPNLIQLLRDHGYTETQLEKLAGGNLWRVLKQADNIRQS